MQVWLHVEYQQFRQVRQPGQLIVVSDGIGKGLIARGQACPDVNGLHECRLADARVVVGEYLDEQMDTPANEMMRPIKYSWQKRAKINAAAKRSSRVRQLIRGKRFEEISPRGLF